MARHGALEITTGAAVLAVAAGFLSYAIMHSGTTVSSGYSLDARFEHIDGLALGSDVRIAGVKVGTVTSQQIDPKSFQAVVSMTVRDGLQLPKDTSAEITSESLLGGKYISLSPGGDETTLKPGQTITITQSSISLEQLLGKFIFSATSLAGAKSGDDTGGKPTAGKQQDGAQQGGTQQRGGGLPPLGQ
jgi:phospholipid/cholesterol/gamma-HCH transport system substrate-binding protein